MFLLSIVSTLHFVSAFEWKSNINWPTNTQQDDQGYAQVCSPSKEITDMFPALTGDKLKIPLNPRTFPDSVDKYGESGTCWYRNKGEDLKTGSDKFHCTRSTDVTSCRGGKNFALTFDDGPSENTTDVLKYLKANNLKATFFLVGHNMVNDPDTVKRIYEDGHELGVHTWSHHALTTLENEAVVAEIGWTIVAFQQILGITPKLFRPPFGDCDDRIRSIAEQMGLTVVIWNGDTNDWTTEDLKAPKDQVIQDFKQRINSHQYSDGIVDLEHDYDNAVADLAINDFLPFLQSTNYFTFQPVSYCANLDSWKSDGNSTNGQSGAKLKQGNKKKHHRKHHYKKHHHHHKKH